LAGDYEKETHKALSRWTQPVYYDSDLLMKFYPARCQHCGWRGLSRSCVGVDEEDVMCPTCYHECEEDPNGFACYEF